MSSQGGAVGVIVPGLSQTSRGVHRPCGQRPGRDLAPAHRLTGGGDQGGGVAACHADEINPVRSATEYVAAIDAAAPPLTPGQRARLAGLLAGSS